MAPPAPTKTPTTTRYFARGKSACVFVPTIANYKAPTLSELSAGTDLSAEIAEWSGWSSKTNFISTPDLSTTFDGKIIGTSEADDSSLTMYMDKLGADSRSLLKKGVEGYIVFFDNGLAGSTKCDVFPVAIGGTPKDRSFTTYSSRRVDFAITREPAEDVAVPTA